MLTCFVIVGLWGSTSASDWKEEEEEESWHVSQRYQSSGKKFNLLIYVSKESFSVLSLLKDLLLSYVIDVIITCVLQNIFTSRSDFANGFCVCVQEQLLGGPRIKHVCRAAAVALGQPRAMVPDDIPRLSALPLHEREGITFSPAAEGTERLHVLILSRN